LISALIVNYFSSDVLTRCLASLGSASEIIIVDNSVNQAEQDALAVLSEQFDFQLITNTFNAGFAVAVNQAAKKAKGDSFLLINPDAYLKDNALERLSAELRADVAVTGPNPNAYTCNH